MLYKLFKRYSLVFGSVLTAAFLFLLAKPLQANAVTSLSLGSWSLSDQVPYQLRGISMVSTHDGWAVGYESEVNGWPIGSVLLHWDGSAWNRVTSPTNNPLFAVKMISANNGWVVGRFGQKLHWDGSTWSDFPCEEYCVDLGSIDFSSANDGWAVGFDNSNGKIERWDGSTWSSFLDSSPNSFFRSVSAISASDAWIVGRYPSSPIDNDMLKAHWDGSLWTVTITKQGHFGLVGVDMLSSSEGWAVGTNDMCHYTGSWECHGTAYPILVSLEMLSANDVWVVGGTNSIRSESLGLIIHWDGNTWTVIDNPSNQTLQSIDMLSANEGWAVGWNGAILHYTNNKYIYLPLVTR